jgi:general secretion pathway protein I
MRRERGFTLLEVMISLAILFGALVVAVRVASDSVRATHRAKMMTIATELGRAKMLDLEEKLLKDGFEEQDVEDEQDFSDEGYPNFRYRLLIEKVQLPTAQDLQEGSGDGSGSSAGGGKPIAAPSSEPGVAGSTGDMGMSMVASYLPMVTPILDKAIRKVTLTMLWKIGNKEESFDVTCFFTDTRAVDDAAALLGGISQQTTPPANPPPPGDPK